jgi:hypothetical protein
MLKFALATSAVVAVGTTAYLVHSHRSAQPRVAAAAPAKVPALRYGGGELALAHAPSLGPSSAPVAIRSRSVAEADLAYLPADSDTVIGVNFAQLRKSALWQRYLAPSLDDASGVREIEALCGFDPVESLGSLSLGLKGLGKDGTVSGVILVHGFERTKARSCFDTKAIPNAERNGTKITIVDDVVLLSMPETNKSPHVAFTFIDATTALIVIGPDATTKEGVQRIAAGTGELHTSSRFAETLQVVNTDASLWLMLAGDSPVMQEINVDAAPYTGVKLGTVYLSMNVTDSLALDAGVQLGSPEVVAKLMSKIQAELAKLEATAKLDAAELRRRFLQLDIAADGSDLIVSIAMSGEQIMQLIGAIAMHKLESESASL